MFNIFHIFLCRARTRGKLPEKLGGRWRQKKSGGCRSPLVGTQTSSQTLMAVCFYCLFLRKQPDAHCINANPAASLGNRKQLEFWVRSHHPCHVTGTFPEVVIVRGQWGPRGPPPGCGMVQRRRPAGSWALPRKAGGQHPECGCNWRGAVLRWVVGTLGWVTVGGGTAARRVPRGRSTWTSTSQTLDSL